ncbi:MULTISPECIES: helix-turn-helix domain-containing protein [Lacticaseibacillus]|uniref:Helix-turn-helix transcriptional regulator n=1 Tax=Lacticaseibacillus huelsenbergensis TaxID=3035291 RepID=A0ABY8DSZ1_9LACO|nr:MULTISPECIES: helix-turn-helix transcriptional regulator [Lacticaseibacillus]MDG3062528.1 helix-turn-helix transcriptional regulator [Lacticaseibacillus sp. BCRC 81376]WFB40119.1 helix-turn-helix transcriptional regulator [Lacticaseibacillus huelsenbergensis]WFB41851.1 helix-turn-helix transcriptional regulator [Lacticaseibacillus huelsenbergensis]
MFHGKQLLVATIRCHFPFRFVLLPVKAAYFFLSLFGYLSNIYSTTFSFVNIYICCYNEPKLKVCLIRVNPERKLLMNNPSTLKLIQKWLTDNQKTQAWLAGQLNMSAALLSQVMNGNRKLQTKYIIAISDITQIPLEQLVGTKANDNHQPQIALRGRLSTDTAKKQIDQLLLDIQHCVDLEETIHAK